MILNERAVQFTIDIVTMHRVFPGRRFIITLSPKRNGRHVADVIFKLFFLQNWCILTHISLKFVTNNGSIGNRPLLVQMMGWWDQGLTLIPERKHHMPDKMWDEITYPFPNFNGCTWMTTFQVPPQQISDRKCQDYVYIKWEYWSTE